MNKYIVGIQNGNIQRAPMNENSKVTITPIVLDRLLMLMIIVWRLVYSVASIINFRQISAKLEKFDVFMQKCTFLHDVSV